MTSNNEMEIEDHCSKTADGKVNKFNKLQLKNMNTVKFMNIARAESSFLVFFIYFRKVAEQCE